MALDPSRLIKDLEREMKQEEQAIRLKRGQLLVLEQKVKREQQELKRKEEELKKLQDDLKELEEKQVQHKNELRRLSEQLHRPL